MCALAGRLMFRPQLQILRSVVVADSVLVMHLLVREQRATYHSFHHQSVFKHVYAPASRSDAGRVIGRMNQNIAPLHAPSTFPSPAALLGNHSRVIAIGFANAAGA